jgi:UDP:flavonoid glycosyltransferase YjiC (YdhE family)
MSVGSLASPTAKSGELPWCLAMLSWWRSKQLKHGTQSNCAVPCTSTNRRKRGTARNAADCVEATLRKIRRDIVSSGHIEIQRTSKGLIPQPDVPPPQEAVTCNPAHSFWRQWRRARESDLHMVGLGKVALGQLLGCFNFCPATVALASQTSTCLC